MKTKVVSPLALAATLIAARGEPLDLTSPADYTNRPTPDYIEKDNTPPGNPATDLGATLGRVLFYDQRLSRNDTIACASCHRQEHGFSDAATASAGVAGTTGRHSMRLVNIRFADEDNAFWDERAVSVEDQATRPIQDHVEMGFSGTAGDPSFADLIEKLSALEEYRVLFSGVFGDPEITEARMQRAIAQFVRSIQSFDSRYDEGRAQTVNDGAPFPNFTPAENAGKRLFLAGPAQGGGGCAICHRPPEFDIDPNSGNNGVIGSLGGGTDFTNTRSPSLRDLAGPDGTPNGPFMHDGSLLTLLDVVDHYNAIDGVNPGLDRRLAGGGPPGPGDPGGQGQRLNLTEDEKNSLVAFLRTLTGSAIYTDPKWSDPFDENGRLPLVLLPVDEQDLTFSGEGDERTVTVRTSGVPNVEYQFESSVDLKTWTHVPVSATSNGDLLVTVPAPTVVEKMFCRFTYTGAAE